MAQGVKGTAKHGTRSKYQGGCRCDECKAATARASRELREKRRKQIEQDPDAVPHGTYNGYVSWCCRCEACTKASRDYHNELIERNGRTPTRWDRYSRAHEIAVRKEKNNDAADPTPGGGVLEGPESGSA